MVEYLENVISVEVTQTWMDIDTCSITCEGWQDPKKLERIEIEWGDQIVFRGVITSYRYSQRAGQPPTTNFIAKSLPWYLTKQYVPNETSFLEPGYTDEPTEIFREWCGGVNSRSKTGIDFSRDNSSLVPLEDWRSAPYLPLLFNPGRHTLWDALLAICDKYDMSFFFYPIEASLYYGMYFQPEDNLQYLLDRHGEIFTVSDSDATSLELYYDRGPHTNINDVKVTGMSSGSDWSYIFAEAKSSKLKAGIERPVEFVYEASDLEIGIAAALADELLDRLQTVSPLVTINLKSRDLTILPLICYEDGFWDSAYPYYRKSDLIVVLTSDIWFGRPIAQLWHCASSYALALSTQRPVVRVSTAGPSCVFLPNGSIVYPFPVVKDKHAKALLLSLRMLKRK